MKVTEKDEQTDGGFTLVEVLVASMILVVALLTLASMFPMGYRQITDAGRMTMAVSGISHPHITTTMLPTMVVPAPILNMAMVQDSGPGGALYMVPNDPHAGIMPSSMDTTTLVSQPGAELGYGAMPMPVDPQQM